MARSAPLPRSLPRRGRPERQLRIIGGRWRGRRFRFPALPASAGLRPTPDRVRETLFNWLQARIGGARVLDLYAGSGALGLEALSRGAASVVFVDQLRACTEAIERLLRDWGAEGARVVCGQALGFLARPAAGVPAAERFDVVFLDPPFEQTGQIASAAAALDAGWLAPESRIYIEHAQASPLPPLPAHWRELGHGRAGEVGYHLFAPGRAP